MNFTLIISRLEQGSLTGDEIAEFRSFCAAWLFRYYEQYGKCLSFGARWKTGTRERYKSMAECERAYEATDEGKKEIRLKCRIKGVEAVQEVLTSLWFQVNKEAREANRT